MILCFLLLAAYPIESGYPELIEVWRSQKLQGTYSEDTFAKTYGFAEVAEDKLLDLSQKKPIHTLSSDPEVSFLVWRSSFAQRPWQIDYWLSPLSSLAKNISERPAESLRSFLDHRSTLAFPWFLALALLLLIHLLSWAPAFKLHPISSRALVVASLLLSVFTGQFYLWLFAACILAIIYSKRPTFFILSAFFLWMSVYFEPLLTAAKKASEVVAVDESFEKGRLRLGFSDSLFERLSTEAKINTLYLNHRAEAAMTYLPTTVDSSTPAALQYWSQMLPLEINKMNRIQALYSLDDAFTRHQIAKDLRSIQKLTDADRELEKISADKIDRIEASSRIMGPVAIPFSWNRLELWKQNWLKELSQLSLSWISILMALVSIIVAVLLRKKVKGCCILSGRKTETVAKNYSKEVEQWKMDQGSVPVSERLILEADMRSHTRFQRSLSFFLGLIYSNSADAINEKFFKAWFISGCLYSLMMLAWPITKTDWLLDAHAFGIIAVVIHFWFLWKRNSDYEAKNF